MKDTLPKDTLPPVSDNTAVTLSDADISSERNVSRRSVLGTLGIGTSVAAAAVFGTTSSAKASDPAGRGRVCPYRDSDTRPSGRPFDTIRVYCGRSDGD